MDKKAQIAETMTWIVATIIIMVILSISIFAASSMAKVNRAVTLESDDSKILLKKSLQGYLLTQEIIDGNGISVFTKLSGGNSDTFSEVLGKKIFNGLSGDFNFDLKLNPWNLFGSSVESIKVNEANKLEVFRNAKTTATK